MLPPFPKSSQMNEWGVFIFDEIREVGFLKIFNVSGNFGSQQKYASQTTELGKQNKTTTMEQPECTFRSSSRVYQHLLHHRWLSFCPEGRNKSASN